PWPHGPTNGHNMWSLCRRHHRIKTAGIITTGLDEHGRPDWHLPTGRRVTAEQIERPVPPSVQRDRTRC
ncbi:MAG: hypothetical protein WB409_06285, partial [Aeromicrobium sp.]